LNLYKQVEKELREDANDEKARHHYRFFKAFPGGYGEGDRFFGITVPMQRKIANRYYQEINTTEVEQLLQNPYHECRLTALFIMRLKFEKSGSPITEEQHEIIRLYLANRSFVNNWDLVDSSAPYLLGPFLYHKDIDPLATLAASGNLWEERIAVLATFYFIRQGNYRETFKLAKHFHYHEHDLMHKAVGWMLREIGKRDFNAALNYLKEHYHDMPRTMLRYAIEKFEPDLRQQFLKGTI